MSTEDEEPPSVPEGDGTPAQPGDLTGDGFADILFEDPQRTLNIWDEHNGVRIELGALPSGFVVAGQGNFDGRVSEDVLLFNAATGALRAWTHEGAQFALGFEPLGPGHQVAGVADLNRDGYDDVIVRDADGDAFVVFVSPWFVALEPDPLDNPGTGWTLAATGDVDGDGFDDLIWRRDDGSVVIDHMGDGAAAQGVAAAGAPPSAFATPEASWAIFGMGDFNGDGREDMLWRHDDGTVVAWLMNEAGSFASHVISTPESYWQIQGTGDYDNDGDADILWQSTTDGDSVVYLMDGNRFASSYIGGAEAMTIVNA